MSELLNSVTIVTTDFLKKCSEKWKTYHYMELFIYQSTTKIKDSISDKLVFLVALFLGVSHYDSALHLFHTSVLYF